MKHADPKRTPPCTAPKKASGIAVIPLHQGKQALIDPVDLPLINMHSWSAVCSGNTCYAKARINGKTIYMHRLLVFGPQGGPPAIKVDHINRDGLDNRRLNLRAVTHRENMMNSVGRPVSRKCRYKGVSCRSHPLKPYRAVIEVFGRQKHLGYFASEEEAAEAYDKAALRFFGSHARTNQPEKLATQADVKEAA